MPIADRNSRRRTLLAGMILAITSFAWADEGDAPNKNAPPPDAEAAIAQFKLADGFQASLFAAEPRVQDIAAFCIDPLRGVFVVETFRRRGATLDVRNLPDWLNEDLASRSVGDRIAMVKNHRHGEELRQMQQSSDRLRLVVDRDGDGRADADTVFSEGYHEIEDGTAAGVLSRGNDVYFANIPNLWLLHDKDGDGKADEKKNLAWGFGVRYAFSGHDLHGLTFGPDGRLYFSIGDRALHVEKTVDGRTFENTQSGAVIRCNPDGTEMELYATGLRNPQELAFDDYGNLFTCDNNSDSGDAARWVYVVEGSDNGWRVGYQTHDFPVARGPWDKERLWDVNTATPGAYMVPPIANPKKISGPSGLTFATGAGLPDDWAGRFFLVDFRGGPANSGIYALKNEAKGAGFGLAEVKPFVSNVLPTDCDFGYDGALYFSDWINGWEPKGKGRIYRVFNSATAKSPLVAETAKLMREGMNGRSVEELIKLLGHADRRVRQAAQFELAKRPAEFELFTAAKESPNRLTRLHAIWALGQIARKEPEAEKPSDVDPRSGRRSFLGIILTVEKDEEIRAQAARMLADAGGPTSTRRLIVALKDPNPRVRYFAALGLRASGGADAVNPILEMLWNDKTNDPFLFHAAVMGLSGEYDRRVLLEHKNESDSRLRKAVLMVLRRQKRPEAADFLNDSDASVVVEAARAINDVPIESVYPALAAMLDKKNLSDLVQERALNASYRLGAAANAQAVAAFAQREDAPQYLRIEALRMLDDWASPPPRDRVTGAWQPLKQRDGTPAAHALAAIVPGILKNAPDAVRLAAVMGGKDAGDADVLRRLVQDATQPASLRAAALTALARAKPNDLPTLVSAALSDEAEPIRLAAIRLQPRLAGGIEPLKKFLASGSPREKQAVYQAIARVRGSAADELIAESMRQLVAGKIAPEARLDLLEAAAKRNDAISQLVVQYQQQQPADDPLAPYRDVLAGGDAQQGRQIFTERADVQCLRCHAIAGAGGNAGPDLAGVATRGDRRYLLESILLPNKQIAKGFETVLVRDKKGKVFAGVLVSEDENSVILDIPDQGMKYIAKKDIQARRGGMSAMPEDIAKPLSKNELRDLIEFLSTLKETNLKHDVTK